MKKKLYYIFGLFMCFIFTNSVYAEGVSISLEGSSSVNKGESSIITVKLTSDKVISSCQFKIESTEGLVFVTGSDDIPLNSWSKTGNITDGYTLTRPSGDNPVIPDGGILNLSYTVNDSGSVTIKDMKCIVEEDSSEQVLEDKTLSIVGVDPVDDTTLKEVKVSGGTDVNLDTTNRSGMTQLDSPNFGLEIVTNNPEYQDNVVVKDKDGTVIEDISNITFNDPTNQGQMILYIIVNGGEPYELDVVYRRETLDNSLKYVKINGKEITLTDDINYFIELDSDVNKVDVEIALMDSDNFKLGENSNIGLKASFSDFVEENLFIVIVPKDTSLGGLEKSYSINIKKKGVQTNTDKNDTPPVVEKPTDDDREDVLANPPTSDISMFVMILILISSLIVSVVLYRRNLESYK